MMNTLPSRRRAIQAIVLTLAIAGCADTPPAKIFTLAPQPGQPAARSGSSSSVAATARATSTRRSTARAGTTQPSEPTKVSVKTVQIAKYLDRPQMVRYSDPYQLQTSEFERWGEGFSDMTTRVLVENLAQRLPHEQVFAASGALTTAGDVSVEVDIVRFEPDPQGTVLLDARWAAVPRQGPDQGIRSEQIQVKMASDSAADQVAAMSAALGELADRIAAAALVASTGARG